MMLENHFRARILGCFNPGSKNSYYLFKNLDAGEEGSVPAWCLDNFADFGPDLLDENHHLKVDSEVWLRDMGDGRIYPGTMYPKRTAGTVTGKVPQMSRASLYEKTVLFETVEPDLKELWSRYAEMSDQLEKPLLVEGIRVREADAEQQRQFLLRVPGLKRDMLPIQESETVECKVSFVHPAAPPKVNERMQQYRVIFAELAAFANSHLKASLFIGVNNKGVIQGVEKELLNEVPFNSLADFQADFINQLNIATQNYKFTSSLVITWYRTEKEQVFCKIDVPQWNDELILLYGSELYVRNHASKRQLKNGDLIAYIVDHYAPAGSKASSGTDEVDKQV